MPEDKKQSQKKQTQKKRYQSYYWIYFIIIFGLMTILFFGDQKKVPEITQKRFENQMLKNKDVEKIEIINKEKVQVYLKDESLLKERYKETWEGGEYNEKKKIPGPHYFFKIGSVEVFSGQLEKAQEELPEEDKITVVYKTQESYWEDILSWLLPLGLLILFWYFIFGRMASMKGKGGGIFSFGKSNAKVFDEKSKSQITFKDVAGLEEAKEEVIETVNFLKEPEKFTRLGAKIPKGIILAGPPGTGKTLLAKAVAGEAGVPFLSTSGSGFVEMFVGVGASRIRDLFKQAKQKAPSIIFIDEIDTIGRDRGRAQVFQSNDERESTLNQLLSELDGFEPNTGVIVMAATNRAEVMDKALLRPGRFDRQIHLELPNIEERKQIFGVHMQDLKISEDVDKDFLAKQIPGFSGADIANICNEAGLIAARDNKDIIEREDFIKAIDRVVAGMEKKSRIISEEEKKIIAYHESGHAVASWYLKYAHPLVKVSIIPRGKSLGAAWYQPEEHKIITRSRFIDNICSALGGRAAEEITFDEISSNALDDLERATKQAYNMVAYYGLSDKLRNISFYDSTGSYEQSLHKPYSEETAKIIDQEVKDFINKAYQRTKDILQEHNDQLNELANRLLEKENVYRDELEQILGTPE